MEHTTVPLAAAIPEDAAIFANDLDGKDVFQLPEDAPCLRWGLVWFGAVRGVRRAAGAAVFDRREGGGAGELVRRRQHPRVPRQARGLEPGAGRRQRGRAGRGAGGRSGQHGRSLTLGKEKYADVQDQIQALLDESESVRVSLQRLLQLDTEVYGAVSVAMKLPRDTDEQKAARDGAMQVALKAAADVPLAIAEQALWWREAQLDRGRDRQRQRGQRRRRGRAPGRRRRAERRAEREDQPGLHHRHGVQRRELVAGPGDPGRDGGLREEVMALTYEKLG